MMLRLKAAGVNKPVRDAYPKRLLAHDAICNTLCILLLKNSMQKFPLVISSEVANFCVLSRNSTAHQSFSSQSNFCAYICLL